MGKLIINNKVINASIQDILLQIRKETGDYFNDIKSSGDELMVTCPVHSEHREKHPSCGICIDENSDKYGIWHCFTCGASGKIQDLVALCFNQDLIFANEWLEERFGDIFVVHQEILPEIELTTSKKEYLDEEIINQYKYFHPYMFERGLSEEIIRKFSIGCTEDGKYITFPCWDIHNNLIGIFKRSTVGKEFIIPKNIEKPIYLLNFILQENITKVFVCEGIFDALVMWTYGFPAICLFGAGTSKAQIDLLNSTGIRNYILMYDNDLAGRKGAERFKQFIRKDVFVTDIIMPKGKDCASCTKEEILSLIS